MTKTPLLLLFVISFPLIVLAQTESEAVYLKKSTALEIGLVNDNLQIVENHKSEKKFFKCCIL